MRGGVGVRGVSCEGCHQLLLAAAQKWRHSGHAGV
jgi:hypothetical protein